jgi:hypothetical protein
VNIQEKAEFDCQKMNRDTWSDLAVKSVVRAYFVLWQVISIQSCYVFVTLLNQIKVLKDTEEGMRYCRFYPIDIVPHIAIIDSRTGERLEVREGFIEPKDLVVMCMEILSCEWCLINFFSFCSRTFFGNKLFGRYETD